MLKMKYMGTKLMVLAGTTVLLGGCQSKLIAPGNSNNTKSAAIGKQANTQNVIGDNKEYTALANQDFKSGSNPAIKVNNGKSTLAASEWKNSKIDYGNLDSKNRTTTDTAYLSRQNIGKSQGHTAQTWNPTGWHNQPITVNGTRVFPQNRGHLIAYTLTFN